MDTIKQKQKRIPKSPLLYDNDTRLMFQNPITAMGQAAKRANATGSTYTVYCREYGCQYCITRRVELVTNYYRKGAFLAVAEPFQPIRQLVDNRVSDIPVVAVRTRFSRTLKARIA